MANYQFPPAEILVQPSANGIGPFRFNLSKQLPPGDSLASVEVTATLDILGTPADLVADSSVAGNAVNVYFRYPAGVTEGKYKLTFKYILASGGKDEADFCCVVVKDI